MAEGRFLTLPVGSIKDGSWLEQARSAWARGEVGLVLITPEPSPDKELRDAVATMLESNGSYRPGDRAVIHVRPAALDMGCETAVQLAARKIESKVVLGMGALGREVSTLMAAARTAAGGKGDAPAAETDPAVLEGVPACYRQLLAPIEESGHGHWIVPIGTAPDPEPAYIPAIDVFLKVAGRGLAPIGALRNDGRLLSHDIWLYPSPLDVERLNEGMPKERHWTLSEWRSVVFRSMAASADTLRKLAMEIEGVRLTIKASLEGGVLHYTRADGTDFTYSVDGRPVILDCGAVGTNSLGGTTPYRSAITNQPTTEVFVAPIEDSLNGVIVYSQPQRTPHGVIRAPYRIEVKSGQVVGVDGPDEDSRKILRNYAGLAPFDGKAMQGKEAEAFALRRVIAEAAIAGFNPAMQPEIMSGRLRPVTGLVLTDEKLGDHQAFGSNDQFMGKTPSTHEGEHVEHTDFVGSIERHITLE